jgi:hypothetical protein
MDSTHDYTQLHNHTQIHSNIHFHTSTHTHSRVNFHRPPLHILVSRYRQDSRRHMVLGQLEPQMEKIELISSLVHRFIKSAQRLLMVS